LDELLGLPSQKKPDEKQRPETGDHPDDPPDKQADKPQEIPVDPTRADLDRRLEGPRISDEFVEAVELMKQTSARLAHSGDAGLETQRLQEEVLRKLDKLIDQARRNKKKSSKSQQQAQSESQSEQNQQQQQSSQQQQQQQGEQLSSNAQGGNVPPEAARPNAGSTGASSSWGDLPAHVREALLQGVSDRFSSTYERMTQEYYKRLAEQRVAPAPPPRTDNGGGT
jgi:hypothetical protein